MGGAAKHVAPRSKTITSSELQGKTALVTGAGRGLGQHFAQVLAAHGAAVILAGRNASDLEQNVQYIRSLGGVAEAISIDVTEPARVDQAFLQIQDRCGAADILVNNAGVARIDTALQLDYGRWQQTMATNLDGVWLVAQAFAKALRDEARAGSLINISSVLATRSLPGHAAYSASKAAVLSLTQSLALEWARYDIRVNALMPGYFQTDMNEQYLQSSQGQAFIEASVPGRCGDLHELDGALMLLASDAGSYITGAAIPIDGGHGLA